MSEGLRDLHLLAYEPLTPNGFALPLFGQHARSNTLFVAICEPSGDHCGRISGFAEYVPSLRQWLPEPLQRPVVLGDPWVDVFLSKVPLATGTPTEIWQAIGPAIGEVAARAPLSALDAAINAGAREQGSLAVAARAYVGSRFGEDRARSWATALVARTLEVAIGHAASTQNGATDLRLALGMLRVETDPLVGAITLAVPEAASPELRRIVELLLARLRLLSRHLQVHLGSLPPSFDPLAAPSQRSEFSFDDLLACARGELFGPGYPQLPAPPLLAFDRVTALSRDGGAYKNGFIEASLDVSPDLWFFSCHHLGDPVMPSSLALEAFADLMAFHLGWIGAQGRSRTLGYGDIRIVGQVMPSVRKVTYKIQVKRLITHKLMMAIGDGVLEADGQAIIKIRDIKVGLFSPDIVD